MEQAYQWTSVGLFAALFCVWWALYRLHDRRVTGYVLLSLALVLKTVTVFTIEPFDTLIVIKTFSVIPFVLMLHYHRHDAPDSRLLSNAFVVVLAVNIVEPSLVREYPQGTYLNATTGILCAILTLLAGWDASTVEDGTLVGSQMDWSYANAYFFWHICLFYAQTYELNTPSAVCVGNYFVFDTVLCGFPIAMCLLSRHGPGEFGQARAYSLCFKLTMNALWTSGMAPEAFVGGFFFDVGFDPRTHFWFQVFAALVVAAGLCFSALRRWRPRGGAQYEAFGKVEGGDQHAP